MTTIPAVRPKPLPSQAKPWRKAAVHLLVLYAVLGLVVVRFASNMYGGLEAGRVNMASGPDGGMLPYIEDNEVTDQATGAVTEIGPLNYDLRLALGDDWFYSGYSAEDKQHICQSDPAQVWAMLVKSQGYADTPENRATADKFYDDHCASRG